MKSQLEASGGQIFLLRTYRVQIGIHHFPPVRSGHGKTSLRTLLKPKGLGVDVLELGIAIGVLVAFPGPRRFQGTERLHPIEPQRKVTNVLLSQEATHHGKRKTDRAIVR